MEQKYKTIQLHFYRIRHEGLYPSSAERRRRHNPYCFAQTIVSPLIAQDRLRYFHQNTGSFLNSIIYSKFRQFYCFQVRNTFIHYIY